MAGPDTSPAGPDRWASHPAAYLAVAGAIDVVIVGVLTAACGWTAGWIAAALLVVTLGCAVALIDRWRDQRRHATARTAAFDGDPPGPTDVADDLAAATVRFPYPPTSEDRS